MTTGWFTYSFIYVQVYIYIDLEVYHNLYGWAMSQYLPTGNFRWMKDKEINKIRPRKVQSRW